jgi:MFS family permease
MSKAPGPVPVRPRLVLLICCLALLLVSIDNTIVNVALPDIATRLDASVQSLQSIVGAYVLALGSLLLLAGSLADRFGRKRIFIVGLMTFTSASAAAGLAADEGVLIALRAVQGAGGAMMTPVALAIVSTVFTDPGRRAGAIGWWGAVSGIGIALGPLIGGPLVDAFGWRSVFWVNVPLGLAAVALTAMFVPESRLAHPRALDPVAQLLVIAFLGPIALAVIRLPVDGVASSTVIAGMIGLLSAVALVAWELRRREPLVDVDVFRDRIFTASFGAAFLSFFAFAGLL